MCIVNVMDVCLFGLVPGLFFVGLAWLLGMVWLFCFLAYWLLGFLADSLLLGFLAFWLLGCWLGLASWFVLASWLCFVFFAWFCSFVIF